MENQIKINENDQLLFNRGMGLFVGNVVEIREKAIKVDYSIEPAVLNAAATVYSYSIWIPKSVLALDNFGDLSVKKWFANKFEGGHHIRKYFFSNGQKVYL